MQEAGEYNHPNQVTEWYPELAEGRSRRMVRGLKKGVRGATLKGESPSPAVPLLGAMIR